MLKENLFLFLGITTILKFCFYNNVYIIYFILYSYISENIGII